MEFLKHTWEVAKQASYDFWEPVLHPVKNWWLWVLVLLFLVAINVANYHFGIVSPSRWIVEHVTY